MKYNYSITNTTLNLINEFAKSYERFEMLPQDDNDIWLERLIEIKTKMSAFAAITIDKTLFQNIKNELLPINWKNLEKYPHR